MSIEKMPDVFGTCCFVVQLVHMIVHMTGAHDKWPKTGCNMFCSTGSQDLCT